MGRIGRLLRRRARRHDQRRRSTPRQPGSALKPFTYALAFEQGFTPASVLADVPSHFPDRRSRASLQPAQLRRPATAGRCWRASALAGSENVPAVALAVGAGRADAAALSRAAPASPRSTRRPRTTGSASRSAMPKCGSTSWWPRTPRSRAAASGSRRRSCRADPRPPCRRRDALVSARSAFWITDILADPEAREYVFGRGGSLEFPFPVAVKTGTSQAYHDNWTIGYTRDVTVGVWVGNFDRTPLRNSTGVTGAGADLPRGDARRRTAAGRRSGGRALDRRRLPRRPRRPCRARDLRAVGADRQRVVPDSAPRVGGRPSARRCRAAGTITSDEGLLTFWPAEYRQWARERGIDADSQHGGRADRGRAGAVASGRADAAREHALRAGRAGVARWRSSVRPTAPPISSTRRCGASSRRCRCGAVGRRRPIEWRVSGHLVGSAPADAAAGVAARAGHAPHRGARRRRPLSEATVVVR